MKTLFTSAAVSRGGRSGSVSSPDDSLNFTLGNPLDPDAPQSGPTPETLFAAAYSACYHGALLNAAERLGTNLTDSTVRALVSLLEEDGGGFRLAVELHASLPGVENEQAMRIMEAAHLTCPYSRALRGDNDVHLVVD